MFVSQGQQQITLQPGQQVAQTADGQTIVYQPVNADGSILQQGNTFTLIAGIPTVAIVPFLIISWFRTESVMCGCMQSGSHFWITNLW